jgi:hypothetical protein
MTNDVSLLAAQREREDRLLDAAIDRTLTLVFSKDEHPGVSEADTVGPHARKQLKGLLKYYAKQSHPFNACVKDNMKRFGPNRTERVCATLKDIIRGTTHWRGHPELDHGSPGAVTASNPPVIDEETAAILLSLSESELEVLFSDAQEAVA